MGSTVIVQYYTSTPASSESTRNSLSLVNRAKHARGSALPSFKSILVVASGFFSQQSRKVVIFVAVCGVYLQGKLPLLLRYMLKLANRIIQQPSLSSLRPLRPLELHLNRAHQPPSPLSAVSRLS